MAEHTLESGESGWMPVQEIRPNPFGAQSMPETLQAVLNEIGTLEQWTTKYGQMFDHDISVIERVSRLLTEGVKDWNFMFGGRLQPLGRSHTSYMVDPPERRR